jgi:GH25 family lysozyme M1 (1,4-beta-N-acetylmuramidase)
MDEIISTHRVDKCDEMLDVIARLCDKMFIASAVTTAPAKRHFPRRQFLVMALVLISNAAWPQNRPMGTDVSSYQATVDWPAVRNDGVSFAWAKCTEGTYYYDAYFTANEVNARSAGVLVGAYHYARPSADPGTNGADTEAAYFWSKASNYVTSGGGYLVPMLDWEDVYVTNAGLNFTAAQLSAWVNQWCNDVSNYARTSGLVVRPVVYTGSWYSIPGAYPGLTTAVTNWPSWFSDYPYCTGNACGSPTPQTSSPCSSCTYPWTTWNLWQYGDTNWSGGDSDVFNGTSNQFLQLFLVGGANAPRIAASPPNLTVAQGSSAAFSVAVSGGTPLFYHWRFDGTNVAAMTNDSTNSVQYVIAGVQLTNAGAYAVQISNTYGSNISAPAFLSVTAPLSNAPAAVIAPAGLLDWWPANGNAIDIVNGCNGLPTNGFFYAPAQTGMAFHFDGSTSYLTMTNSPADVAVPWTLCLWVYRQQTPQTSAALLSDGTYTLKLEQYNDTHEVGMTQLSVQDWTFTNSTYTVPLQTWTHLAFVAVGSDASAMTTLYVNGALRGTIHTNIPLGRITMGAVDVSGAGYVDFMEGSLEGVMIFNKALTAAQVKSLYSAGSAGLCQAPQFLGVSTAADGNLTFNLEGLTGSRDFTVYYSTNLPNWSFLATLSAAAGSNQFAVSPTNTAAFFRATQP